MLNLEDIVVQVGRGVGGDFMKVVHEPTGIFRVEGPPLPKPGKSTRQFLREIEAELIERGLTQYLVVARRSKR